MNKKEALIAAINGKEVLSPESYAEGIPIVFDGSKFRYTDGDLPCINDHSDTGWEIVKETKKVKLYQYANSNGLITNQFFTDDLKYKWTGITLIKRAPKCIDRNWVKTNCFIEVEIEL